MDKLHFHRSGPSFCAETLREAIADSIEHQRLNRGLTDSDVGELTHKSRDRVGQWRARSADMPLSAWFRLLRAWGPAFAWRPLALAGYRLVRLAPATAAPDPNALARLDLRMREIEDRDIIALEREIEAAGALVDHLRQQLAEARGLSGTSCQAANCRFASAADPGRGTSSTPFNQGEA